jgi:hypothetical protein
MQTASRSHPLTPDQLRRFAADGFLIVDNFFSPDDLLPVQREIDGLVDDMAQRLLRAGRIRDTFPNAPFEQRLTLLERAYPGAAVLIHIGGILKPALQRLWSSPRLLDLIEQVIGPEIAGHPVWNLRSKTPLNPLATVPWHQDTAYLAPGCEATLQPTAWIPLVDVSGRNGTMQVVRGGHRHGVLRHRPQNTVGDKRSWYLYIDEQDVPKGEIVTCEMKLGSFLLLNQVMPHRSTENHSDVIRWSVDLRWQRPDEPSGFEGIKDPILMRTAADRAKVADWSAWAAQNRIAAALLDGPPRDEFDTTVSGPWMERWRQG